MGRDLGFVLSAGGILSLRGNGRIGSTCSTTRRVSARSVVRMNAHGGADSERRPGAHKGFVEEMRFVAMRLHTKDQAKEGEQEKSALPINEWKPTKADYLQFLVDSKCVYDYMEGIVDKGENDMLTRFRNSGLERKEALETDIASFKEEGFSVPEPTAYATKYVSYLENLVDDRPNAFLCHWYNYYFAHTAGGRMIGRMMSNLVLDGRELEFYKWDKDVKEILGEVRVVIDDVAKDWSRDVKDDCLKETQLAFSYSGTVLGNLAKAG